MCGVCGKMMQGVHPKGATSEKKPSRKFSGALCEGCSREVFTYAARVYEKEVKITDIPLRFRSFVESAVKKL